MYDMTGFDYDISDVVNLLKLQVRHKNSVSLDVNCPFCGETKGKMNVNLRKNVFRCNRCDVSGGMLDLYGRGTCSRFFFNVESSLHRLLPNSYT